MIQSLLDMGIVVDIFGRDWEMSDFENNAQVRLHGEVAYQKMLQVIAEASIVVNDEACFNDGAHDRVFTAAVYAEGQEIGRGSGSSKKRAEQAAAGAALSTLQSGGVKS